ncbi:sensor histidine kinase, partial [Cribrihabitans sp. XS_ASV171]
YEPVAAERDIVFEVDAAAERLPGHPALLAQALSNLIENALRYAPDGSTIGLSARTTEKHMRLAVADEGPGVPEADLHRLEHPFVTLDPSRGDGASGLGLALVAAIARMHGGGFEARRLSPGFEAALTLAR